ncbi:helix-turn-helix transcriptional regulator [Asticcacaulis sp. DW145]|uniref:Helix-turn-helix transcriptional regulator n=1 Tax=Asticcacaulis currens TaxID=2984210 RepID=A0ABT5IG25_9CAUL|nr:helix-turn-helix transcriptional regulator [Asticcacaulis currens]MDC7694917.1 helix-turn-helix transcriptional regulator [Asticcacaulis currens]BEV12157.1 helix-turn-helix transcriptional regulator [Asticcacaulis sp. DW145]
MSLSHAQIWNAIDRLALNLGTSPSGLARLAGLDPTAFNKSKRQSTEDPPRPRWPSTESLAKLLEATGQSFSDFAALTEPRPVPKGVPLIGFAQAGNDGLFDDAGFPVGQGWDEIGLPAGEGLYALEISGDSMLPLYRDGDRIIVDPLRQNLRRGDRVVVKTSEGEVMAKELVRLTEKQVELRSLNPDFSNRVLERAQVTWMARIVWASQ